MNLKSILFYFSPALLLFANNIVINNLRPLYGRNSNGIIASILGWLPNYFAGLGFLLLGLVLFTFLKDLSKKNSFQSYIHKYMALVAAISAIGLIWWEFEQKSGSLIFDIYDIYATIGGVLTGYLIFIILYYANFLNSIKKGFPRSENS